MINMKLVLPYLINVPPFMLKGLENKKISFYKKIYLIIKGRFVGSAINKLNGKSFCIFLNLMFKNDGKIYFDGQYYFKKYNDVKIFYPNKRIQRILIDYPRHLNRLLESYNLDEIKFEKDDVIIDCGSNIGELNLALKNKNYEVKYYGFEPDNLSYECNILNNKESGKNIKNVGLADKKGTMEFYEDSFGGNSSLIDFGEEKKSIINVDKLDNFSFPDKIKLLKIDAEGYEPEVLAGAKSTLKNVKYVAVDFGPERGIHQDDTIVEVNNLLIDENFELIKFETNRVTGLYKNKKND